MPKGKEVETFCNANLTPYAHKELVKKDIIAVVKNFNELDISRGQFYESNGQCRDLVKLHGTIPVHYKGNVYHIPVCLWLDHQHPHRAPICMVEPTQTMHVKPGKHVDSNGMCYLPYLHEWRYPNSDILNLIQVMQLQFGEECPVFSRPAGAPAATVAGGRPTAQPAQPSYPPRPGGAPYQPPAVGGFPSGGYGGMPLPGQPRPGPPGQPYNGARGPQPPYPAQGGGGGGGGYPQSPYQAGPNATPYPSTGPAPYPNSSSSSSTPYPTPGPARPPQPGYPGGFGPGQQAPYPGSSQPYPGGPAPPYPGANSSSSNTPYPSTCSTGPSNMYSTYPPPGQASSHSGGPTSTASHHNSIMSTTPAGLPGAMVTEQLRGNEDPDIEGIRRRSLVCGVEDKLRRRLQATMDAAEHETRELQQQQRDLHAGTDKLNRVMGDISRLQAEAELNIATMTSKSAELQDLLEKLDESANSQLDVDDAVVATYPLYTQMIALIAEDSSIDDTLYYLGEALRKKVLPLDVFLKHVRELSTRQYMIRATLQRAQDVAGL
ncbi:tumor susceptibility gene 101 protein-like isoform X3 [Sycon ciliatum]|uniref:tumor susceptibility gene 101 protein-like isoform X3 n=1 Tax=Sycon ciliatum TaxID=27933 RepID=UPI0031F69E3B